MRLREVFRFEVEYRVRSASTWIYAGILFALAFMLVSADTNRGGDVHVNAAVRLAQISMFIGLFGMMVSAALFADAAVRDVETEMDPLLFTSRLGKAEYLGGRFLAALAVNAVTLVAVPLGQVVATLRPDLPAELVGPFRVGAYLQPYLLFQLPNLALVGAVLFTIAVLARQVIPVYLGAIGIFIGYLIALNFGNRLENPMLSALADPLGMSTLLHMTRYWPPTERNTRLVGLPLTLVLSRVAWLAVAAALLALLHRRFRFAHADGGASSTRLGLRLRSGRPEQRGTGARLWRRRETAPIIVGAERGEGPPRLISVPRVAGTFGLRTRARQTLAIARNSLEEIAGRLAFVTALLVTIGVVLLWGWNVTSTVFETSVWPVTFLVAETALSERIRPLFFVFIALYAGELVWKDRDVGVAEIADAAPVPEGVALLGRFLAIVAILATLQCACLVGGVLIQTLQGYFRIEPGVYLRILFGLNLVTYVLLAALATTIHVIVNQKYLAHVLVLMACVFTVVSGEVGIRHHLLIYGTAPGWTYSDMNGVGPFIVPFVWFTLYWAAWALLLAVVANLLWVRGREPGVLRRLGVARARFAGPVARTAGVAIALILVLGGFIFNNTNILNAYRTPDRAGLPQAEYERRYKRFEDVRQPVIVDAELRVEIYPESPGVDMRGTYHLINRTGAAIDSVHVFIDPKVDARAISFDRAARAALTDDEVGYRIYALERALEPGGSLRLAFDVSFRPRGFPNSGIQTDVASNGAYFNRRWMPIIGYQPAFELSDEAARRRFDLRPHPLIASPDDDEAGQRQSQWRDADNVHVKTIIGTADGQIAVTTGVLRRTWTENPSTRSGQAGRRYFEYETETPTSFGATVYSAQYAVLEDRWIPSAGQVVDLRIYHHPAHTYVLDGMMRSMKASLDYYTAQFGPYLGRQLRIIEIPRYGRFGRAHPQTIAFTEDIFLSRVTEGEFDQMFFGTAHEVAHQWTGQLRAAKGILTESLANYCAMMVTEKTFGPAAARRVYAYQMDRYLRRRAGVSRDVPLLDVTDQAYLMYGKGAIVMYMLREQIGEERVNTALRRLLEKHRAGVPPYPTSSDLYAELRAVTPDSLQSLLVDLFETVTLWDVKTERTVVEPTGEGEYRVTIDVVAKKMRADSVGTETEVPMDDLVEIGVFAPGGDNGPGEPLYLTRHRIRSGKQTISLTVPRKPARAGIDPYHKLIDRQGNDNVVEVKAAGADPVGAGR